VTAGDGGPGPPATPSRRPLRILFFAGGARPFPRPFAPLVTELVRRGHLVHLAFDASKGDLPEWATDRPGLEHGFAPERRPSSGWRSVAWLVRALPDLARYSHPRYSEARVLRERMTRKIVSNLTKSNVFEPVGRRLALRLAWRLATVTDAGLSDRVIRVGARLEAAIPTCRRINRFIREQDPDIVLATPVVNRASTQVDYLKSARRLGIPTGVCVASWDNLTNKGLLRFTPERVLVWNEIQRREAVELHGIPEANVVATGAQLFDQWFERRPSRSRDEFVRTVGLDPAQPYVLYVCSNPAMTAQPESGFVLDWVRALRESSDDRLRRIGVVVRPHPNEPGEWREVDLRGLGSTVVWPTDGAIVITDEARAAFFDSLAHSAAVVGINTTAMIEAALVGKSVLTVLAPDFAQESTLHFHYLLAENGGFLHVASSLREHVDQLARLLDEDAEGADRRRRFVESFVRPRGLERPATPILADAVEELADLPVDRSISVAALTLRVPLALEAAATSLAVRVLDVQLKRSIRRWRRVIKAKARRIAQLSPGS
jgi:hypothetical protein